MSEYDIVIGLEIHAELKTKTKVFCACKNQFGSIPNSNTCPVCVGLPGSLPVLNREAVKKTILAGLVIDGIINERGIFERKNYFYPDLSKAYQISQLENSIVLGGHITLDSGKKIRINRIHLEEDAGKLTHRTEAVGTLIDYNRGGIPLAECVTEPDISSVEEAVEFLSKLQQRFIYAGVADCKMEEGGMRCDVNLSVKKKGASVLGTRTETKNLNSFKMVARAIEFEAKRQIELLESGERIVQETRKWDDNKGKGFAMRSKETSQDYRYFPDPDLLWIKISKEDIESLKKELPMLPEQRKQKYMTEYGLPEYDANVLTSKKEWSDYYDECCAFAKNKKALANWIMVDMLAKMKEEPQNNAMPLSPKQLGDVVNLLEDKKISRTNAKDLFLGLWRTSLDAFSLAKESGWLEGVADDVLHGIVESVILNNPKAVQDYALDSDRVFRFFVGQVMKETKGKANAEIVSRFLKEFLHD